MAVSAETAGKGGVDLKVFGVGVEAGVDKKAADANRIEFSVPVRLPYGDQNVAKEIAEKRAAARKASQPAARLVVRGVGWTEKPATLRQRA